MKKTGIVLSIIFLSVFLIGCSSEIRFNSNGGTEIEPIKVKKDEVIVELPIPELEGNTFVGWYLDENFTEKVDSKNYPKNTNLYAKWEINQYLFIMHYEGENVEEIPYYYNQNITPLSNYQIEGYTFQGWYIDKTFKTNYILTNMPAYNVNVYAKLLPNKYLITFHTNGGTNIEQIVYNYNDPLKNVGKETKLEDSIFKGWYLDSKFTRSVLDEKMPDEDINLYAKWKNYTIVQKNIAKAKQILVSYGCSIDLNIPDRCMNLTANGLSVDFHVFYDNWKSKTLVFSIGHMYEGHAVWYSPDGLNSMPKYTIGNNPAPKSEVEDVINKIPLAINKIEQIEASFASAGLERDDLIWP